jgi:hypothetical protein
MNIRGIFSDLFDGKSGLPRLGRRDNCWCYLCLEHMVQDGWPIALQRMILCPDCGNKRCPRATDHNLACTRSNDPGQLGSRYQ